MQIDCLYYYRILDFCRIKMVWCFLHDFHVVLFLAAAEDIYQLLGSEILTAEPMEEGLRNLEAAGNAADYIITHCAPTGIQNILSNGEYVPDSLTDYFERLRKTIRFRNWFFGHYHDNRIIEKRFVLLYEQIVRVL